MVTVIFVVGPFVTTWLFNLSNTTAHPCYSIIEEEVEKKRKMIRKSLPMWLKLKHPKPKILTTKENKVVAIEIKVENTKGKD